MPRELNVNNNFYLKMLILVILLINVNGQILKKVSECMGACHYCYSAEPTKCIANSSLIIPCD